MKNKKSLYLNLFKENRIIFKLAETTRKLDTAENFQEKPLEAVSNLPPEVAELKKALLSTIEEDRNNKVASEEIDAETEKLINNKIQDLIINNIAHYLLQYESTTKNGKKLILNNIKMGIVQFFAINENSYAYQLIKKFKQTSSEAINYHLKENAKDIDNETLEIISNVIFETLGLNSKND